MPEISADNLARPCHTAWLFSALRAVWVKASSACAEPRESSSRLSSVRGRIVLPKFRTAPALQSSRLSPIDPRSQKRLPARTPCSPRIGLTPTSADRSALLSANMATIEESMLAAGVDRIVVINTLLASLPGSPRAGHCASSHGYRARWAAELQNNKRSSRLSVTARFLRCAGRSSGVGLTPEARMNALLARRTGAAP